MAARRPAPPDHFENRRSLPGTGQLPRGHLPHDLPENQPRQCPGTAVPGCSSRQSFSRILSSYFFSFFSGAAISSGPSFTVSLSILPVNRNGTW